MIHDVVLVVVAASVAQIPSVAAFIKAKLAALKAKAAPVLAEVKADVAAVEKKV